MATLFSAFSRTLFKPDGVVIPPIDTGADKNWTPGQWIEDTGGQWGPITTRLAADTAAGGFWKGVMIRKDWESLESDEGNYYGFNDIENKLAEIGEQHGRRLIIFFQVKTFGGINEATNSSVPEYMRDSATYATGENYSGFTTANPPVFIQGSRNGQYAYASNNGGQGGFCPNLHNTAVMNRFKALFTAFGERFNDNPYLEGVVFSEAEISTPFGSDTATWQAATSGGQKWWKNMTQVFIHMKSVMSNIQICQWVNSPRPHMAWWVPEITAQGIGLGMTDGCRNDHGFNITGASPGNIWHLQQNAGKSMNMVHMSHPSIEGSVAATKQGHNCSAGGFNTHSPYFPGPSFSRQSNATWAKTVPMASHVVWIASTESHETAALPRPKTAQKPADNYCDLPAIYPIASDAISGSYAGKKKDAVTDAWIKHPSSDISTQEARPPGWT